MNTSHYNLILKLIEYGTLSDTATALNYTQSAVSYTLKEIESEWGITLFTRGKKGVSPTVQCLHLLPSIREAYTAHQKLVRDVDSLHGLERGSVSIGTFSSISTHILPPVLKMYRTEHPNITLQLMHGTYSEIEQWLLDGTIELGFLEAPSVRGIEMLPLGADQLVVALPMDHPLADHASFPTIRLVDEPYIETIDGADTGIRQILERNGIPLNITLTARGDCETLAMVESGIGISIFPELLLYRTDFKVHVRPLDYPMERKLFIAFKSKDTLSYAASHFIETLLQSKQSWGSNLPFHFF